MTTHPVSSPDPPASTAAVPGGTGLPSGGGRHRFALVAAAVAVAVLAAVLWAVTRPAPTWDRDTPQGTVQAYVTAVLDGDAAAATALLAPGSLCDAEDFDRSDVPRSSSVELAGTEDRGTTALVRIRVGADTGDPLGGRPGEEHVLRLTRTDAGWRIDGTPWPLFECTGD